MTELDKRREIIGKARLKYIRTGITRNITEALKIYLQKDAGEDEQIPLFITTPEIYQIKKILEEVRPRCDECNSECHLQINARDPAGQTYPTAWICKNCGLEYFSDMTPAEWLKELQDETRKQNLRKPDEPDKPNLPDMRPAPEI